MVSGIRKVPIADKVKKYWIHFYNKNPENQYLLTMNNRDFSGGKGDTAFRSTYWKPFTETLDMKGRHIHETRHTCATLLNEAEIYPAKINRILGHSGKTISESVYTHLDIQELVEAINKI